MIFANLLKEAVLDYQFDTTEDLVKAVKGILRKASFPRYMESKSKSEKGFSSPSRNGYKYKFMNNVITVSFFGAEKTWEHELSRALTAAKINYLFNEKQCIFMIKSEDNVSPDDLLSPEAQDELETNKYHVIGKVVDSKHDIKEIINTFTETQRSVYVELTNSGLIQWQMAKFRIGNQQKFKYALKKIGEDTDDNV